MSALGQKRTSAHVRVMSALPPKAEMDPHGRDVRFVPKADSCTAAKQRIELGASTESLGRLQVDEELELC